MYAENQRRSWLFDVAYLFLKFSKVNGGIPSHGIEYLVITFKALCAHECVYVNDCYVTEGERRRGEG